MASTLAGCTCACGLGEGTGNLGMEVGDLSKEEFFFKASDFLSRNCV